MTQRFLCFLTAAMLCLAVPQSAWAQAEDEISFQAFYDGLAPYGEWVYTEDYGYVWQPSVDEGWRPYTDGSWAYTDGGWTWLSNEPWGWATYHYGRWIETDDRGWLWIPGTEWAPAWVSWRSNDEYVGWAPLPPEAVWQDQGFGTAVDVEYNIPPAYYSFIPVRYFGAPLLASYCLPRNRNIVIFRNTRNITRIRNVNNFIFIDGPDYDRFSRWSETPIRRAKLQRRNDFDYERIRAGKANNWVEGDTVNVIAPRFRAGRDDARPAKVSAELRGDQLQRVGRPRDPQRGQKAAEAQRERRQADGAAPWDRDVGAIERQREEFRREQRQTRRQGESPTGDATARRDQIAEAARQRELRGQQQGPDGEKPKRQQAELSREERQQAPSAQQQQRRRVASERQQQEEGFQEQRRQETMRNQERRNVEGIQQDAQRQQQREAMREQQQQRSANLQRQQQEQRNAAREQMQRQQQEQQRQAVQREQQQQRKQESPKQRQRDQGQEQKQQAQRQQQQRQQEARPQRQQQQEAQQPRQQQKRQDGGQGRGGDQRGEDKKKKDKGQDEE